ncbi:TonB-dependent receptor [Asticcacaulis sp. ZE23SCel15]|uniref:TonB-dependent receptor n=1 Tax=Asticcacaulis sp. ZE23SCel15 TaxID=3059027 RepID=UPI00265FD4F4|nr:TonB-dependent receptor [Asticcacaulis sp. ZE23SCel15]WKL57033.1 TonB-dependent receptor [Asticcacaulis sp. ZE23SCel15]
MNTTKSNRGLTRAVRAAVLCSASTLALVASGAYAQDAAPASPEAGDVETVIVTGVRGSLQRSMNIKRNAIGVVDAISAEDIGKYPDTNLAESIQRISGVSINRINGEGSEVTVRGFGPGFNLTTLNGRVMPSANIAVVGQDNDFGGGGSRNFDFSNIASDGVSGFEVYKTGKADVASGGIGATLNIKTLRPINRSGSTGSITVKGLHGENMVDGKDWTPEVSGAYSWGSEDKTFGVAVFGSYSERDVATRTATQNSWNIDYFATCPELKPDCSLFLPSGSGRLRYDTNGNLLSTITNRPPDGAQVSYANDSRYQLNDAHTERTNLQATVQWRPAENWLFTADALYAENKATENRSDAGNWFNRPFDQVVFEQGASGIYNAVFMQENLSGTKDMGFEQALRGVNDKLTSYGLNAEWNINDSMTLTLDAHSSKAEALPGNPNGTTAVLIALGAPVIASHSVDFRGEIPIQRYVINDGTPIYAPNSTTTIIGYRGNRNGQLDLGDLGSQVGRMVTNSQSHKIDEFKANFRYDFDSESRFDAGIDFIKSKMDTTTGSTYQALGDWGISNPGDVQQYAPGLVQTYDIGAMFQDFTPGDSSVAFRGNALDIYNALADGYNVSIPTAAITSNQIEEDIKAIYGQFMMKGDFLGMSATVVAGLRYEKTDVTASALQSLPTAIRWTADNDTTVDFNGGTVALNFNSSYHNWLPNLDVSLNVRDDIVARGSFSKTIARPSFGNMYATTTVNGPPRPTLNGVNPTATSGNPGLLPLELSNVDFSVEWYYGPTNYASIGFYNKDIANFVGQGSVEQSLFGLRDPSSGQAGSRSGTAATALAAIGQGTTDVNLFTMTALLIKNNGNATAATAEYQANSTGGNLNQSFVDQVLAAYDITADANDPLHTFVTSIPINNKTANLYGFELAFQHFFGDTGFGVAGSLTTVDGDVEFDNSQADTDTVQFPLLGLSDTYNVTLIYDKGPLSGRLSYNWRDEYISGANRDGSAHNPTYVEAFGVVDVSVNYQVTPSIQLTVEGLNLTKEHIRQHGRDKVNLYYAQELDTRYQVGLRYKF